MRGAIAFFCVMLWCFPAQALCVTPYITASATTLVYSHSGDGYDPYNGVRQLQSGGFTVGDLAGVGCEYYVVLSAGGSGSASARRANLGGNTLNYNMYVGADGVQNWGASGAYGQAQVISGSVSLDVLPTRNHTFYWDVTPLQVRMRTATPYTDTVSATLYARTLLGWVSFAPVVFNVQISVKSSVDVSVGNTTVFDVTRMSHVVDLGVLKNNVTQNFHTVVRSNDGHILRMTSVNQQKLKHVTLADTIDYTLSFEGSNVDLSAGNAVVVKNTAGTTATTGQAYQSGVTIKNMNGLEAIGIYRDVINISVSAQ